MFNFKFTRSAAALAIVLCLGFSAFADTVRLKDGSVVKGRVVGFKDGQFVISVGEGSRQRQMSFYQDEVSAIEFETSSVPNSTVAIQPQNPPQIVTTTNIKNNGGNSSTPQTVNASITKNPAPIRLNTKVLADNTSNGWTNTGWVVKKGQRIRITGAGRISLGNGRYTTPSGVASIPDGEKLMKAKPTGGMIAVIGDDNNDFLFVGSSIEFTATRDGALFLGINEGYLDDNSGSYDVNIEIDPS